MASKESVCIEIREKQPSGSVKVKHVFGSQGSRYTLSCLTRNCFSNMLTNKPTMTEMAGKDVEIVAGSLGVCDPAPVYFEWGGMGSSVYTKFHEFIKCPITGLPSVHWWCVDADGKVWDVLDPYLFLVAKTWGKTIDTAGFIHGRLIAGKSVEELERQGLKYIRCDSVVDAALFKRFSENVRFVKLQV